MMNVFSASVAKLSCLGFLAKQTSSELSCYDPVCCQSSFSESQNWILETFLYLKWSSVVHSESPET